MGADSDHRYEGNGFDSRRDGGSCRVLVVDDNVAAAQTLAKVLELWGHDCRVVHTGELVMDTVRAFEPDVVLLDINMPGMDGYAVAATLRQDPTHGRINLIATTGHDHDEVRRKILDVGFDGHLLKPLQLDSLQSLLGEVARKRQGGSASVETRRG